MSDKPAYPHKLVSTTEGRRDFPNLMQDAYGEQTVVGAHRYGRLLGAIVSEDAVRLLAGEETDPEQRIRIRNAARNLLREQGLL